MSAALKKAAPAGVKMTPEREALAAAIKAKAQHAADLAASWAGLRKLDAQIAAARTKMDNAEVALATAQEAAANHAADTASGKTPPAPVSLRDARSDYADAQDDYVTLKRAYGSLDAKYKGLQETQRTGWKYPDVVAAARAVLKSEIDAQPLFAEIRALQDELIKKRLIMCFLRGEYAISAEGSPDTDFFLPTTQSRTSKSPPDEWEVNPAPAWRTVFDALCEDAATELPPL
jgi:hypothetical protein